MKKKDNNCIRDQPIHKKIIIFGKTNDEPPKEKREGGNEYHNPVTDIAGTKPKTRLQLKFLSTNGAICKTIQHVIDAEFLVGIFMLEHRTTPATGAPKREYTPD